MKRGTAGMPDTRKQPANSKIEIESELNTDIVPGN